MPRWLPVDTRLARVPKVGRFLTAVVPCWNYTGLLPLSREELRDVGRPRHVRRASPRYDKPQTLERCASGSQPPGLVDADVRPGGNGIPINARRGLEVRALAFAIALAGLVATGRIAAAARFG